MLLQTSIAVDADLEFQKGCNESVDGERMVDHLLQLVAEQLKVGKLTTACMLCDPHVLWMLFSWITNRHAPFTAD